MRGDEPVPAYEYLHSMEEKHDQLKEEIYNIQDPSLEVIHKYVVDVAYVAIQLSLFVSTMIESTTGAFEAKIDYECDENNIHTMQLEEVIWKHQKWISHFQAKWSSIRLALSANGLVHAAT